MGGDPKAAAENINRAIKANQDLKKELIDQFGSDGIEQVFGKVDFPFADHMYARLTIIEPEKEYMDSLEFDPGKIKEAFEAGRERAQKVLNDEA